MYLPRVVYEALPYAYVAGGFLLCAGSYAAAQAAWTEAVLLLGAGGVVLGLVLLLRRRAYRDEAARYDARSLDELRTDDR